MTGYLSYPLYAVMLAAAGTTWAADLRVEIANAASEEAPVYVALYDSTDSFEAGDGIRQAVVTQWVDRPSVVFADLPAGRYAVAVFQDISGDGELDTNLLGRPTEPFGFSRNAMGNMGPPSFDDMAVSIEDRDSTAVIELRE